MLSPFTKPGTKIVCIDAGSSYGPLCPKKPGFPDAVGLLTVGAVYTLVCINKHGNPTFGSGFVADLEEVKEWSFDIARFRPAVLPKAIMDILLGVPIDLCIDEMQQMREDEDRRMRELMPPI